MGAGTGQRGFRLRDVGAGNFADPEPIVGGLQLLGENLFVVALQFQQLAGLNNADIGIRRRQEARLLLIDQDRTLGHHLILGAVDVSLDAATGV